MQTFVVTNIFLIKLNQQMENMVLGTHLNYSVLMKSWSLEENLGY